MKFQDRGDFGWGKSGGGYAEPKAGLVIHYDGSDQGLAREDHDACVSYWKNTRTFHTRTRGWADIGYSFGACPHGYVMEGRGLNRQQAAQPGGNSTWYSCTLMSGPGEDPTAAQINAVRELRAWLMGKGVNGEVKGHRDFISTSCPGDRLYRLVKNGTFGGAPSEEDDMPLTKDDLEAIRKVVWDSDKAPVPPGVTPGDNPTWRYVNMLREVYGRTLEIKTLVTALAGQAPDVDEDAIAQAVLAQLTPERIAAAIPAELAEQVVTALGSRLTPKES